MALIPLDYLPVIDTISRARSLSDIIQQSTAGLIDFLVGLIEIGGDAPLFDSAAQAAVVINWSSDNPSTPEVYFEDTQYGLESNGVVMHRASIRFDVLELVRGEAFGGNLSDIVALLRGERWTSICENLALLHYGAMLADYYNMTNSEEAA